MSCDFNLFSSGLGQKWKSAEAQQVSSHVSIERERRGTENDNCVVLCSVSGSLQAEIEVVKRIRLVSWS